MSSRPLKKAAKRRKITNKQERYNAYEVSLSRNVICYEHCKLGNSAEPLDVPCSSIDAIDQGWPTLGLEGRIATCFPKYPALACSKWLDIPEPVNQS